MSEAYTSPSFNATAFLVIDWVFYRLVCKLHKSHLTIKMTPVIVLLAGAINGQNFITIALQEIEILMDLVFYRWCLNYSHAIKLVTSSVVLICKGL